MCCSKNCVHLVSIVLIGLRKHPNFFAVFQFFQLHQFEMKSYASLIDPAFEESDEKLTLRLLFGQLIFGQNG